MVIVDDNKTFKKSFIKNIDDRLRQIRVMDYGIWLGIVICNYGVMVMVMEYRVMD